MIINCVGCGIDFSSGNKINRKQKYHDRDCYMATKPRSINAKTTRYHSKKIAGVRIAEHRFVMEQYIGRKLKTAEFVHHKNGIKTDNRIENLEIVDPVTHGREHHLIHPISKPCSICGNVFTPHKTKRKRQQTCSGDCAVKLRSKRYQRSKK